MGGLFLELSHILYEEIRAINKAHFLIIALHMSFYGAVSSGLYWRGRDHKSNFSSLQDLLGVACH